MGGGASQMSKLQAGDNKEGWGLRGASFEFLDTEGGSLWEGAIWAGTESVRKGLCEDPISAGRLQCAQEWAWHLPKAQEPRRAGGPWPNTSAQQALNTRLLKGNE